MRLDALTAPHSIPTMLVVWIISGGAGHRLDGDNWHVMHLRPSYPRPTKSGLLLGLVLMLVSGGEGACAESVSSASWDAESHAHVCKCGSRCRGASCCCGRHSTSRQRSTESVTVSSPDVRELASGPCLGEAPCGDPGLPGSTASVATGRTAALSLSAAYRPSTATVLLAPPTSCRRHPRSSSRIDRPPRPRRSA